ncbi:MAG TPA: hypothetical protein PLU17_05980 [Chitinophagaceae bacterium]|nr:hypothetical protein [Chitinophagaceae bacterium]
MRIILLLLVCLNIISNANAQIKSSDREIDGKKIRFSTIQQVGVIGNGEEVHPAFQVVFGAQYKRYFLGVGAAIDPYFANSFPLFLDGRFTFYEKRFSAYVYGDLGINKMLHSNARFPREWSNGQPAFKLHTGLYHDYGIGMKTKLAGNLYYNFSIGMSFKETKYSYTNYTWPSQQPYDELYRNVASRFAIRMGLQF